MPKAMRCISRVQRSWDRDRFAKSRETVGDNFLRHLGIYGYRAGFIRRYVSWEPSPLENIEMLEQLRVLWYGEKSTWLWQKRCLVPVLIPQKTSSAFALKCVNFLYDTPLFSERSVVPLRFSTLFLFNN